MSSPESREQFRASGEALRVRHAIHTENKNTHHAPITPRKPARRSCVGCGLNRSAFATKTEFDTHERICLFGGLS